MAIPDIASGLEYRFLSQMHENSDIPLQYNNMEDDEFKDAIVKIFDSEA